MEEEKLNNLIYLLRIHHIDSEPLENLIKGYKELEEELEKRIEQKVLDYRYVDKEMIPKSKVKEIFERNIKKETYFGANGYSFSFKGCQAFAREIWKLLQEGDDK